MVEPTAWRCSTGRGITPYGRRKKRQQRQIDRQRSLCHRAAA
jgi:hypothetical protein